ncbi:hypothetical protein Syun_007033 [Stephania yunnanensis]|uniref:Uncharacterized protein n=1 Tax=Stephania yunnanensis TaxID=152371 RepID=A0AAP0KXP0_9MAGN
MSDYDSPIVVITNRKLITKLAFSDTNNDWNAIPHSPKFINSLSGIGEGEHSGNEDEERPEKFIFESVNINGIDCEEKCSWLWSQIIGGDVEIATPFGKGRLT